VWKWAGVVFFALFILGTILPESPKENTSLDVTTGGVFESTKTTDVKKPEADFKDKQETAAKEIARTSKTSNNRPLTKEEVLSNFAIDEDIEPYVNGQFIFVGGEIDTADYYTLADTERYRNASVIFKDGQIVRVKFIPLDNVKAEDIFTEFGITDKPRKINGMTGFYEVALIPQYWSRNIERHPFELD